MRKKDLIQLCTENAIQQAQYDVALESVDCRAVGDDEALNENDTVRELGEKL